MNGSTVAVGWGLGAALLAMTVVAVVVALVARLGVARDVVTAVVRAVVQLAVVSAVIVGVVRHLGLAVAFAVVCRAVPLTGIALVPVSGCWRPRRSRSR